jgi:hypothetical protein
VSLPYVSPLPGSSGLPTGLSLVQFIQTVLVGVTAIPGTLTRPKWQPEPPKQPDINVDWLAFGIDLTAPDASAYLELDSTGKTTTQRQEGLEVSVSIYGPNCDDVYGLLRDGFQLPQNRIALHQANMNFTEVTAGRHIPDLVNQRWIDRVECSVLLRRQIQRTYPVLTFVSASGIIYVPDVTPDFQLDWEVTTP